MNEIRLTAHAFTIDAAAPDGSPRRTIMGLAAPYFETATTSDGRTVRFMPGSLPVDGRAPVLLQYHDSARPVGIVTERVSITDGEAPGVYFSARISDTEAGRETMTLAADGVLTGVSVGATPTEWRFDGDVMEVTAAVWSELSVVPMPAFESSRIHQIAAASGHNGNEPEPDADDTNPPVEESSEMAESVENVAAVEASTPVTPLWAQPRASFSLPSVAEYMVAFSAGGSAFANMNARIQAAAPNVVVADTPGLMPEIIVGSAYDSLNPVRPFVSAIGTRAMPTAGATFRRAKIGTRPVVTEQPTGELNTLDPSTVTVTNTDISKKTFGTYVTVSEQDVDWSDPASLNIILEQLAIAYGQATDNYAVDQLVANTTQTETVVSLSDPSDWIEAIYGAAYQISNSSNYLPTHWVVNPVTWAKLGMLVDNDKRPVFPTVGPMNASGTQAANSWNGNPLGLTLIVDKNIAGGTTTGTLSGVIGHAAGPAAGFEFYEQQKGAISVDVPSTLGRTIAWRGYAAVYMADATKFVKLVNA